MYNQISNQSSIAVIGGVNVIEDRRLTLDACLQFLKATSELKMPFVFKASFDKANRTSRSSYRGVGMKHGLEILREVKEKFGVNVLTDVHETWQVEAVADSVDFLQLPAFLARQTDLIVEIARSGKPVNIKKPQFMSPSQVVHIVDKFKENGNEKIMLCERGSCFGYDQLVVDMLGIGVMKKVSGGLPIIFDITHSLQCRTPDSSYSSGRRSQFMDLALAGVATRIAGVFIEAHENPDNAKCDGASAVPLKFIKPILEQICCLDDIVKKMPVLNM
jgi:2-dehydro-3-deoxyphosphooctonate aldolase (KDO 8-P synthase)